MQCLLTFCLLSHIRHTCMIFALSFFFLVFCLVTYYTCHLFIENGLVLYPSYMDGDIIILKEFKKKILIFVFGLFDQPTILYRIAPLHIGMRYQKD